MSPHGINSLVGDLVEMAKATERLPQLEAELDRANSQIESYAKQVQDRELAIISYKQEIDELHAKVRSLEVERDDASFRVLEAEDREHVALNMARSIASAVGNVINTLDPPKPEPMKEPEPNKFDDGGPYNEPQAQPVTTPAEYSQTSGGPALEPTDKQVEEASGQSESSPTQETALASSPSQESAPMQATSTDAVNSGGATSAEPTHGPYYGKRYRNVEGYITLRDWLAGGGTEADYYYSRSPY